MKKTLAIILALVLVLAFAAGCSSTNEGDATDNSSAVAAPSAVNDETARGAIELADIDEPELNLDGFALEDFSVDGSDTGESFRVAAPDYSSYVAASED